MAKIEYEVWYITGHGESSQIFDNKEDSIEFAKKVGGTVYKIEKVWSIHDTIKKGR